MSWSSMMRIGLFGKRRAFTMVARQVRFTHSTKLRTLTKNIDLCTKEGTNDESRPVVLLFEWLGAKKKHVIKYSEYYLSRGYDSLLIRVNPVPLLWPPRVQGVVDEIIDTLSQDSIKDRSLLVHAFSVGAYLYGECLVRLKEKDELKRDIGRRIFAQILDSPVNVDGFPNGFSKAVSQNVVLRSSLRIFLSLYLSAFSEYTTQRYLLSFNTFKENPLNIPALFLYSLGDPVADPGAIDVVIKLFEDNNFPVFSKCWKDSPHCSHMYRYPGEYQEVVERFIDDVGSVRLQHHA